MERYKLEAESQIEELQEERYRARRGIAIGSILGFIFGGILGMIVYWLL